MKEDPFSFMMRHVDDPGDPARLRNAVVALIVVDGLLTSTRGTPAGDRDGVHADVAAREVYARTISRRLGLSRTDVDVAVEDIVDRRSFVDHVLLEPRLPILPGFRPRSTPALPAGYAVVAAKILTPPSSPSAKQNLRLVAAGRVLCRVVEAGGAGRSVADLVVDLGSPKRTVVKAKEDLLAAGVVLAGGDVLKARA
jgi:hypothetical protein